jgi:tRNA (guanine-N7-)-methyltransferase
MWQSHFGNENPIRLEIGCGKGKFIAEMASAHPELNFIALERDPTILAAAARHGAAVAENANIAYVIEDVENLPLLFAPGEIDALYIQFCDPWRNKKKWAKRRLTHIRFLECYRKLGICAVFFKTDNRILFEFSIEQFSEAGWLMKNISLDLHSGNTPVPPDALIMTEYETKFMNLGQPIYRLEAYDRSGLNVLKQAFDGNEKHGDSSGQQVQSDSESLD